MARRGFVGIVCLVGVLGATMSARASVLPKVPNCQRLLTEVMREGGDRLAPLKKAELLGLKPVARNLAATVWTVEGPVQPAALEANLNRLFDHIINLSLVGTGNERLFERHPDYVKYLAPQRRYISRLLEAWTNPETGHLDLSTPALLLRNEAVALQKLSTAENKLYREAVRVKGERSFRSAIVIPGLTISGVDLKWLVRLYPSIDGRDVQVVVQNSSSLGVPSPAPSAPRGHNALALYGALTSLFGQPAKKLAMHHQQIYFEKVYDGQLNVGDLALSLERLAKETGGQFHRRQFLSRTVANTNLKMLMLLCARAQKCKKLSAEYGDAFKRYLPHELNQQILNRDGTYDFGKESASFSLLFDKISDEFYAKSDDSFRMWGWPALKKFSEIYFADFDQAVWDKVIDEFRITSDFLKKNPERAKQPAFTTIKSGLDFADRFWGDRVIADSVNYVHRFDFDAFEQADDIRSLSVFSLYVSFRPSEQAFHRGDLTEDHVQVLVHRLREHLGLPP